MASFPLIFIAETHGFIDDFGKEKEIIEKYAPEFVLSEYMQDIVLDSKLKYEQILIKKKISKMVSFNEVKELIKFCYNKNIKLIGIDIKNFGFNKQIQNKIKKQEEIRGKDEKELEKIMKKREENHIKIIKRYLKKTNKPIIVLLGAWHLRENSLIRKSFKEYNIISPLDEKGNILIEPPKKSYNIKYGEFECH